MQGLHVPCALCICVLIVLVATMGLQQNVPLHQSGNVRGSIALRCCVNPIVDLAANCSTKAEQFDMCRTSLEVSAR